VLYCAIKLCTVARLDEQFLHFSGLGFVSLGPITVTSVIFFTLAYFVLFIGLLHVLHHCNTAGWGGPGGIEAYSLGPYFPSVL